MENRYLKLIAVFMVSVFGNAALGKVVYFGGTTETIPVAYGAQTILRFEEAVKTISNAQEFVIKPVSDENADYSMLSIEPRALSGKFDTTFILSSGEIAKLRISVVSGQAAAKVETIYDIKSQKSLVETKSSTPFVGRLELMAAMIRGDQVTGYEMTAPLTDLNGGSSATRIRLMKIYSGDQFKGYIYEIENISGKESVNLDVRKLRFGEPNQAVLGYSDFELLTPKGSEKSKTRLLVVAKATSRFREAVLPIRVVNIENKGGGNE